MALHPQPTPARRLGSVEIGSIQMGSLGRVASPRGVQLIAVDGMVNGRTENRFTTTLRLFSYLPRISADGAMSVDRRPFAAAGPLNFLTPGVDTTTRGGGPVTGAMCIFSPNFFSRLSETESGFRIEGIDFLTDIQSERLTYLGGVMFREAVEPGFASALFAEAIGMEIALEIVRYDNARRADDGSRHGAPAPWQMRRLESYVRDNLSDDLTLSELAALLGVSVRHLSRAVRQAKGVSVHRWIADRRLGEARRLLGETDLPIHEVARRCAFHSASAFIAAFRSAAGAAPGEFRRLTSGRSSSEE
jgi:AraC family transcriptional regulator